MGMNKFKNVISNILYSTDDEENEIEEVELEEDPDLENTTYLDENDTFSTSIKSEPKKASDYLYSNDSAFLDTKPAPKKVEDNIDFNPEKENKEYTPMQTISPVYGVVGEEKDVVSYSDESLKKYKSSTVKDSYLETVISPIFGYAANYYDPDDRYKTNSDDFASSIGAKNDYDNFKNDLKDIFDQKDSDTSNTLDSLKELFDESKQDFDNKEDKVEDYEGLLSLFDDNKKE